MQDHLARALEGIQCLDRRRQLHAIVRGLGTAAVHRPAMLPGDQHNTPTARAGIPPARPVGVNLNGGNGC